MTAILLSLSLLSWSEPLPAPAANISADQAARLYRVEIYNTYRLDRAEYDRRRELGDRVWARVQNGAVTQDERAEAIAWFLAARDAAGSVKIPALPAFAEIHAEAIPVATSGQEDKISLEPDAADISLDIQLPKGAVPTSDAPFFSRLIKSAFRAALTADEAAAKSAPVDSDTSAK